MKFTWKSEAVSLVLIAAMFVTAAAMWSSAPDRIPVHWNWAGQPDRFGGRVEGLLAMPLLAAGTYALLALLPRIDPRRANYAKFTRPFAVLRTVIVAFVCGAYALVLLWLRGYAVNTTAFVTAAAGVLFIVLGNYLPKIKSNWFVGVRTPWTLSSEFAWRRTHHLAGWLFVASGLITLAVTLARPDHAAQVMLGALITAAVISVVYSYIAWRADPARQELAAR